MRRFTIRLLINCLIAKYRSAGSPIVDVHHPSGSTTSVAVRSGRYGLSRGQSVTPVHSRPPSRRPQQRGLPSGACTSAFCVEYVQPSGHIASTRNSHSPVVSGGLSTSCSVEVEPLHLPTSVHPSSTSISTTRSPVSVLRRLAPIGRRSPLHPATAFSNRCHRSRQPTWWRWCERFQTSSVRLTLFQLGY